jgi:hypothetical protein
VTGALLGTLVVLLSGCATAASSLPVAAPPSTPAERACRDLARAGVWRGAAASVDGTVTVEADDHGFSPTCVLSPYDAPLTVVLTNRGHLPHTFSVDAVGVSKDVDAGQTVFLELPALRAPLRVVCRYHVEERMFAAVVPTGAAAGPARSAAPSSHAP